MDAREGVEVMAAPATSKLNRDTFALPRPNHPLET